MRTTTFRLLACGAAAALLVVPAAAGNAAATKSTTYTPTFAEVWAGTYGADGLGRSCAGESDVCTAEATADAATGRLAAAFSEEAVPDLLEGEPSAFAHIRVLHQLARPAKSLQINAVVDLHGASAAQTAGTADAVMGGVVLHVSGPGTGRQVIRPVIDLRTAGSIVAPSGELVLTVDLPLPYNERALRAGDYEIYVQLYLVRRDQDAIDEEDQAEGRLDATVRSISVS